MVRGLFPPGEREAVLTLLERSVVFVTRDNIAPLLHWFSFLSTAWDVANLYLTSVGAEPLSSEAPAIVGLSEEARCYVSTGYFGTGSSRFADFVLHETAHIFHNCKRRTASLAERGRREWLLDIDFRMRETFAYACEAYGRILELGSRPSDRRDLLSELLDGPMLNDDRVDENDYREILSEAVAGRSGWRRILRNCASTRNGRRTGRGWIHWHAESRTITVSSVASDRDVGRRRLQSQPRGRQLQPRARVAQEHDSEVLEEALLEMTRVGVAAPELQHQRAEDRTCSSIAATRPASAPRPPGVRRRGCSTLLKCSNSRPFGLLRG